MNEPALPADDEPIVPFDRAQFDAEVERLKAQPDEQTLREIGIGIQGIMLRIIWVSLRVRARHENGHDVKGIQGYQRFLAIAYKQLSARMVAVFNGGIVGKAIEKLPLDDQDKLAKSPVLPVVEIRDGKQHVRMRDARQFGVAEVALVFGPDGVRTVEEQRAHLAMKPLPSPKLRPDQLPPDDTGKTVKVLVATAEDIALYQAASEEGVTPSEMARILIQEGLRRRRGKRRRKSA